MAPDANEGSRGHRAARRYLDADVNKIPPPAERETAPSRLAAMVCETAQKSRYRSRDVRSANTRERPDQECDADRGADQIDAFGASLALAPSPQTDAAPDPSGEPLRTLKSRKLNGCDHRRRCDPAPGPPKEKRGDNGGSEKKVGDDHFRSVRVEDVRRTYAGSPISVLVRS